MDRPAFNDFFQPVEPEWARFGGLLGYRLERSRQNWLRCLGPAFLLGPGAPQGLLDGWLEAAGLISRYAGDRDLSEQAAAMRTTAVTAEPEPDLDLPQAIEAWQAAAGQLEIQGIPPGGLFTAADWLELNLRLGRRLGEGRFYDLAEQALYNGFLAAQDHGGRGWAAQVGERDSRRYRQVTTPRDASARGMRSLARLTREAAGWTEDGAAVHLYSEGTFRLPLPSGGELRLDVDSHYPYNGKNMLIVDPPDRESFALRLRVPGWCRRFGLCLNHLPLETQPDEHGYLVIERAWDPGDRLDLDLELSTKIVRNEAGQAAVTRGPLVFAADSSYLPEGVELSQICLEPGAGPIHLVHDEQTETPHLLAPASSAGQDFTLELVPFYEAGNRDPQRYQEGIHPLDEPAGEPTYRTWVPG